MPPNVAEDAGEVPTRVRLVLAAPRDVDVEDPLPRRRQLNFAATAKDYSKGGAAMGEQF